MFGSPSPRVALTRIIAALTLLGTGGGGGALLGTVQPEPAPAVSAASEAVAPEAQVEIGSLELTESPQPQAAPVAAAPAPPQKRVLEVQASKPIATATGAGGPMIQMPSLTNGSASCDRLNDRMIEWTRRLAAKTRDANPGTEAVAARVDAHLAGGLGTNMCAAEAQQHLSAFCGDPAVFDFMQKMVKELPFFVRPLVGDPCKHDLVRVAQKYLS